MHSRAKLRRLLALPLIAAVTVLFTGVLAGTASAAANVYAVAYMGTNGHLWYYDSTNGAHDTHLGMEPGTSPALTYDLLGYTMAFDANNSYLYYYTATGNYHSDTHVKMFIGASPVIAQNDEVAFQGANGDLWYYNLGHGYDTHLNMMDGTTPAISVYLGCGLGCGATIAFQGEDGNLWFYNTHTNKHTDTGLDMYPFSSPSIGAKPNLTCCTAAFNHFASDDVWYYNGAHGYNSGLKMFFRTSPAIDPDSGSELIAFDASSGKLWLYNALKRTHTNTGLGMSFGESPSLGLAIDSRTGAVTGYQVWFRGSNGRLSYYDTSPKKSGSLDLAVNSDSYSVSYYPGVYFSCCQSTG